MKLATHITAEKGKELIKTANDRIKITLTVDKIEKYQIYFTKNHIELFDCITEKIIYEKVK
jgi:hypothetical protein